MDKKTATGGEISGDEPQVTRIFYETQMSVDYDLVNNSWQCSQMLQKTARMSLKFGGVKQFQKRILDEIEGMRFSLNQMVVKWYTLQKQVEFLERVLSGEISLPKESEPDNGGGGSQTN